MKLFKKAKKGFTLVELVVVIAVIAILAAVSVGAYFGVTDSANRSKLEQEAKQTFEAIRLISLADPENNQNLGIDGLTLDTTEDGVAEFTNDLMYATGQTYTVSLEEKPQEGITGKTVVLYKNFLDLGTSNANGSNQTYKSFNYYTNEVKSYAANVNLINGKIEIISDEFEITPPPASTAVTGVSLNTTSYEMLTGATYTLSATVTPETATDKSVSWSTSDANVVTVNNGVVTAVGPGTATVKVTTTDGNKTASCTFTVTDPVIDAESIGITTRAPENFYVGHAPITLEAQITPADTTNKTIIWSSSAPGVASVVAETGVVTPVSRGTAVITAKTHNNITATIAIEVKQHATKVELDQESISMHIGDSDIQLNATVTPDNANNKNVTWESSDESVATVNNGKVRAVGNGNATITVKTVDGEHTDACSVSVSTHATSVTINQGDSVEVNENGTVQLTATVLPETSSYTTITWTSSDENKATVNDNGLVTAAANSKGQVTIKASCDGKEDTITVNILRPVNSFGLLETSKSLYVGGEFTLTPNFNNEEPSNTNVTWESNNEEVATVNNGVVTAHKAGTATITAVTENGGKQATCVVTVYTKLNSITLNNGQAISLNNGQTSDEISVTFDPADYSVAERTTSWSSDIEGVATVTDGVVKATGKGTATITYTVNDGIQDVTGSVTVNVGQLVTGIELNETELEIVSGDTAKLTATVKPDDADNKKVNWTSNNPDLVSVDTEGNIKAALYKTGTATITAKTEDGDFSASCTVNVLEPTTETWTLLTDKTKLVNGSKVVLAAKYANFVASTTNLSTESNNLKSLGMNLDSDVITPTNDTLILEVIEDGEFYNLKYGNYYLGSDSSSENYVTLHAEKRERDQWDISINQNGEATIVAQYYDRNTLRYNVNNGSPIFSCYASGMEEVCLYISNKLSDGNLGPKLESFELTASKTSLILNEEITAEITNIQSPLISEIEVEWTYSSEYFELIEKDNLHIQLKAIKLSLTGLTIRATSVTNSEIYDEVADILITEESGDKEETSSSIELTAEKLELSGSYTSTNKTIDGITYSYANLLKNSNNIQFKSKTGQINNSSGFTSNITSIQVKIGTAMNAAELAVSLGTKSAASSQTQTYSGKAANSVIELTANSSDYYYFKIKSNNNAIYISSIVINFSESIGGGNEGGSSSDSGNTGDSATSKTYSYTFGSKVFDGNKTVDLGGVDWTLDNNGSYYGYDGGKGQQIGSGSNPAKSLKLTSASFTKIKKITINTCGASSITGSFIVKVGDTQVGDKTTLGSSSKDYEFTAAELTGAISFEFTQRSSKAIYIKSITVEYLG